MCRSILIEVEFISNVAADALLVSGSNAKANRDAAMLGVAKALARAL
jgi:N-acetylmuramoyl-L-alanine amidase